MIERYYDSDGAPVMCIYCGCDDIEIDVKEYVQEHIAEYYENCNGCGKELGFWAYGHSHPGYRKGGIKLLQRSMGYRAFRSKTRFEGVNKKGVFQLLWEKW